MDPPPVNLWEQRQLQRAQERERERSQSAPRPPASPRTGLKARPAPRNESVKRERQEQIADAAKRREEQDQAAQKERSSSSLRGRQERQERAHSALRERHQRARSARRERQERARSASGERQVRPQSAPKVRTSEPQPVQQNDKRTQSLISEFEAKSRKRPVSSEHELKLKKVKAFRPSEEQPVVFPSESKAAADGATNVTNKSPLPVEIEPMTGVEASHGDANPFRHRSKEPLNRRHGRQFVRRSRSRERSVLLTPVDAVPDVADDSSQILQSQVSMNMKRDLRSPSQPQRREMVKPVITVETADPKDGVESLSSPIHQIGRAHV